MYKCFIFLCFTILLCSLESKEKNVTLYPDLLENEKKKLQREAIKDKDENLLEAPAKSPAQKKKEQNTYQGVPGKKPLYEHEMPHEWYYNAPLINKRHLQTH